jgi:hypothetical protein
MGIGKNDNQARQHWGSVAYDAIPKSVFAVAAWHLANAASGTCDADGAAERAFLQELEALEANQLIDKRQLKLARDNIALSIGSSLLSI